MYTFMSQCWDSVRLVPMPVLHMMPPALSVYMFISPVVSGRHCFLGVIHHPWFLQSFLLFFCIGLSPEGKVLMETSHLGPSAPSLSLSVHYPVMGFCVCFHLLQEKTTPQSWTLDFDLQPLNHAVNCTTGIAPLVYNPRFGIVIHSLRAEIPYMTLNESQLQLTTFLTILEHQLQL